MATLRGEYAEGEKYFRVALEEMQDGLLNPKRGAFIRASTHSQLGENLALQGRVVEGEVEARKAIEDIISSNGRYAPEVPVILARFINVHSTK